MCNIKNYRTYMAQEYTPIDGTKLPYYVDMREMREYANNHGISIRDLSDQEKAMFEHPRKV